MRVLQERIVTLVTLLGAAELPGISVLYSVPISPRIMRVPQPGLCSLCSAQPPADGAVTGALWVFVTGRGEGEISSVPGIDVLSRGELYVWESFPDIICICLFRWPKLLCEHVQSLVGTWLTSSCPTSDQENKSISMGLEVGLGCWCHFRPAQEELLEKNQSHQNCVSNLRKQNTFYSQGELLFLSDSNSLG